MGTAPIRPELAALANVYGRGRLHMGLFPVVAPVVGVSMFQRRISSFSRVSVGVQLAALGVGPVVDTVWPTANRAVLLPFVVENKVGQVVAQWRNGAVLSGNLDVGIYFPLVDRIVSSGSVVQAGANAWQSFAFPFIILDPGEYLVALVFDNAIATVKGVTLNPVDILLGDRMLEAATAFPLPIVPSVVTPTMGVVPMMGLSIGLAL